MCSGGLNELAQMLQASGGLLGCPAFDAEDYVSRAFVLNGLNDPVPLQNAVTTGTTHRRTGHLAAFGVRVLHGDVLGVEVNQPLDDPYSGDTSIPGTPY